MSFSKLSSVGPCPVRWGTLVIVLFYCTVLVWLTACRLDNRCAITACVINKGSGSVRLGTDSDTAEFLLPRD